MLLFFVLASIQCSKGADELQRGVESVLRRDADVALVAVATVDHGIAACA